MCILLFSGGDRTLCNQVDFENHHVTEAILELLPPSTCQVLGLQAWAINPSITNYITIVKSFKSIIKACLLFHFVSLLTSMVQFSPIIISFKISNCLPFWQRILWHCAPCFSPFLLTKYKAWIYRYRETLNYLLISFLFLFLIFKANL